MPSANQAALQHYQPAIEVPMDNVPSYGLTIAVIPDTQVREGVLMDHLTAAGNYIADKRPDVIVCLGDFADMPSLSTHDKPGSRAAEMQRYKDDIEAAHYAMGKLLGPIRAVRDYNPVKVLTYGNHEDRITRAQNDNPRGPQPSLDDLHYETAGWRTVPFLQPVVIGGVAFCHYFPNGVMGKPHTTAQGILTGKRGIHMSAFAGHQQGRDIAYAKRGDGTQMTAIISGSFYQHDEAYMNPYTNIHWRGMYFLHEVKDGSFDEMALSVNYLLRKWT